MIVRGLKQFARKIGKPFRYYLLHPGELMRPRRDVVCTTPDDTRFYCSYENHIERSILETGLFEAETTSLMRDRVHSGDVVFDVGSNIGYYSFVFSKLVGPAGRVHCFEPTAYALRRFERNKTLNSTLPLSNIVLNEVGLLAEPAEREEAIESRFSAKAPAFSTTERMKFTTLDMYVESHAIDRVDLVKIDVDGYDMEVARGGRRMLAKHRPMIVIEMAEHGLVAKGASLRQYGEFFLDLGYDECLCDGGYGRTTLRKLLADSRFADASRNVLLVGARE